MRTLVGSILLIGLGASSATTAGRPFQRLEPIGTPTIRRSLGGTLSTQTLHESFSIHGGGCADSDAVLFSKIGVPAMLETAAMLGVLVGTKKLAEKVQVLPSVAGLPVIQWLGLFLIIFASSFLGSIVEGSLSVATNQILDPNVVPGDANWYSKLQKPSWNPPGWVFPIMWLIVSKPTQMIAVSKILKKAAAMASDMDTAPVLPIPVLAIYCAHLSLGDAWNKVFFGLQCLGRGAAVITVFFALLLASAIAFYQVEPTAGLFLLPTCGWVFVATALNWSIYRKNK